MSDVSPADARLPHDAYAALRIPEFRRFWGGNVLALLGSQMQFVAVGWDIYERTGQTLQLGLVGLGASGPGDPAGFAGGPGDRPASTAGT